MSDQFGPLLDRDSAPQRPSFRDELWSTLADEWNGIETATIDPTPTVTDLATARRRRRTAVWLAATLATAAAGVAALVVTADRPTTIKITPGTDPLVTEPRSVTTVVIDDGATSVPAPTESVPVTPPPVLTTEAADTVVDKLTTAAPVKTTNIAARWPTLATSGRDLAMAPAPLLPATIDGMIVERGDSFDTSNRQYYGDRSYDQWFASDDFTRVLRVQTYPNENPNTTPVSGQQWTFGAPRAMMPGYSAIDVTSDGGTVQMWAAGLDVETVQAIVPTLTLRSGGRGGWVLDAPAGLTPIAEGWTGDGDHLVVVERDTFRVAEVHTGVSAVGNLGWSGEPSQAPTVSTLNGRTVVRFPNSLTALLLGDDLSTPIVVGAIKLDEPTFVGLLGSIAVTTDAAAYDALPENYVDPNQDGCGESLFC